MLQRALISFRGSVQSVGLMEECTLKTAQVKMCEPPLRRACQQAGVTVAPSSQMNKLRPREAKSPIPGALLVKRLDCSFLF